MAPPPPGVQLIAGRYEVKELLGRGGSSAVYRVLDRRGGAERALKLHTPSTREDSGWSWRLRREFFLMAQLVHPNIVRVHDWGEEPPSLFFTMDLISGRDVAELCPLAPATVIELMVAMASALGLIHARGFVHHDIKPRNIRIPAGPEPPAGPGDMRRAMLMDFGLLTPVGTRPDVEGLAGTPGFVAPERLFGAAADVSQDLYALGASAYQLLTAQPPPRGGFDGPPPLPATVPTELATLLGDLVARDQRRRLPDVAELVERLAGFTAVQDVLASAAPSYLVTPPLVGREQDLLAARIAWGQAAAGHGGVFYVVAGPGMGKTHLMRNLALELRVAGAVVAEAVALAQQRTPFGVLGRLLSGLFSQGPRPEVREERTLLDRLLLGEEKVAAVSTAGDEEARVARALVSWVRAAAHGRPVVLMVDDLQWCDEASTRALQDLARASHSEPILVIAAVRVEEQAAAWAERLRRGALGARLLEPLDHEATRALLSRLFGRVDPPASLVDRVHSTASGNPYLVVELARTLVDRGLAVFEAGRWQLPSFLDPLALPATLEATLEARLDRLSADARLLARALAVAGGTATWELLAMVSGLDEHRLLAAQQELEARQVAVMSGASSHAASWRHTNGADLRFVHPRLGEVMYANLDPAARCGWHQRLAEALRPQAHSADTSSPLKRAQLAGELGRHLARAGAGAAIEAARWLRLAGDLAYERGHLSDALSPLAEAAGLLEREGGPEAHPELVELWYRVGLASGGTDVVLAVTVLQRLSDHLDLGRSLRSVVGRAALVGPRLAAVGSVVELAVRRVASDGLSGFSQALGDAGRYVMASTYLVFSYMLLGELDRAYQVLAVVEHYGQALGADALAAPMLARAALEMGRGGLNEGRQLALACSRLLARPRRLLPELERRRMVLHAQLLQAWAMAIRGEPDRDNLLGQLERHTSSDDVSISQAGATRAAYHARRGEITLMVGARERFFEHCRKLGMAWQESLVLPTTTRALVDAGLLARAREDVRIFQLGMPPCAFTEIWLELLGGMHAAAADPELGLTRLDRAASRAAGPGVHSTLWTMQAVCFGAEACLALGRPQDARSRAADASRLAESVEDAWLGGRAERALARAALALGDRDAATEHLRRAETRARQLENPGELAQAELLAAELSLASGLPEQAAAHGRRAEQAFLVLGNALLARRAAHVTRSDPEAESASWSKQPDADTIIDDHTPTLTLH
jgi:hypothetical protein